MVSVIKKRATLVPTKLNKINKRNGKKIVNSKYYRYFNTMNYFSFNRPIYFLRYQKDTHSVK
jgi:hypothetical protein